MIADTFYLKPKWDGKPPDVNLDGWYDIKLNNPDADPVVTIFWDAATQSWICWGYPVKPEILIELHPNSYIMGLLP